MATILGRVSNLGKGAGELCVRAVEELSADVAMLRRKLLNLQSIGLNVG